jgi:chromosome segregation ATPase
MMSPGFLPWAAFGLSVITTLIIPLAGYFFSSLRRDMQARDDRTQEAFRTYALHIDQKIEKVTQHIDGLARRLQDSEHKLAELQIQIAQRETQYVRQFVGIEELRELEGKVDRLIGYVTQGQREMTEKLSACQVDCERRLK